MNRRPIAIRGTSIVDEHTGTLIERDLVIVDGAIDAIVSPGSDAPTDAEVIDARRRLAIPGLVNAHTHGHGSLGKGAGDRWTLELLLNAAPRISTHETDRHKYLTALVNGLEMIRKGCTACYDLFFEFPAASVHGIEAAARGYEDAGMRATIAPMMADRTFWQAIPGLLEALPDALRRDAERIEATPGAHHLDACRQLLRDWPFDRDRLRPALAPTIPLHCTDDFITACGALAHEHGVGLHMHLAESKVQAIAGMERYGKTLTAHLETLDFLGPDFTAAHAIWLDDEDIARLADAGANVAHNPGSNLRLGSGVAAAREMRAASLNVGIGTDGGSCSDNQNMFEAMRLAAYVSRIRSHDPADWLGASDVLAMATRGSARVLGFDGLIGRLEPGYRADITFLDLDHINWLPVNDARNQLVNTEDAGAVTGVMVDGETALWDGRFTRVDLDTLRAEIESTAERLRTLGQERGDLSAALETHVSRYCVGLSRRPYHAHRLGG